MIVGADGAVFTYSHATVRPSFRPSRNAAILTVVVARNLIGLSYTGDVAVGSLPSIV